MCRDVVPDPSLGGQPRARAPATHHLGGARPAGPTASRAASILAPEIERPKARARHRTDGPAMSATSLMNSPAPDVRSGVHGVREGIAFTAVSPFY